MQAYLADWLILFNDAIESIIKGCSTADETERYGVTYMKYQKNIWSCSLHLSGHVKWTTNTI